MLTTEDFKDKYKFYSDEELCSIHDDAENYSEDAHKALNIIIEEKGGFQALVDRLEAKAVIENEKRRISNEAVKLGLGGVDASFIKNTTTSEILSEEEVNELIEKNAAIGLSVAEDKKVNADTIVKSLLGCGLATLFGGAFASLQFLYFGATSTLMVLGTALICYGTVKLVTKKSYNNWAVLISSFAAIIISYMLAVLALSIFGYLG